jgi:hypothetical protein
LNLAGLCRETKPDDPEKQSRGEATMNELGQFGEKTHVFVKFPCPYPSFVSP